VLKIALDAPQALALILSLERWSLPACAEAPWLKADGVKLVVETPWRH